MYLPVFSKDLKNYKDKKVCLIGKVIDIQEEKKVIRLKLLDTFGFFDVVLFDVYNIKLFDTLLILGSVSEYNNNFSVIARYLSILNGDDEILWRKFFIKKIKKNKKKNNKENKMEEKDIVENNNLEEKDIKKEIYEEELPEEVKLRKQILEFIRDNDKGDGVSLKDIKDFFDISEEKLSNIIMDLLSSGEIYESSPEKYKVI
ncbi:Protein containing OB-fold-like and PCI domains [Candidatus Nanobsidianus stetteri]|uniref:Protein containing OB-fold-like and PCI domains n=1 Tax=Nanobsidianus stetteri TaxID=1294122 RepID=R1GA02_NANST|nr:Protein containing OB-fold-like and PCI domains [Candidatus Nanobsidianus stetteri]